MLSEALIGDEDGINETKLSEIALQASSGTAEDTEKVIQSAAGNLAKATSAPVGEAAAPAPGAQAPPEEGPQEPHERACRVWAAWGACSHVVGWLSVCGGLWCVFVWTCDASGAWGC